MRACACACARVNANLDVSVSHEYLDEGLEDQVGDVVVEYAKRMSNKCQIKCQKSGVYCKDI